MKTKLSCCLTAFLLIPSLAAGKGLSAGAPTKLPGLKAAASITRDVHGIAHVRANNEHDLFFPQGFVHAQDRLFQMDVSRRRGSGTLAELLGPAALPSDVELRTIGLRRAAQRSMQVLSARTRGALTAYAAGVNAYVARHSLPPEYAALELTQFAPWTALDSVAVAKLIAFGLSFDLGDIQRTVDLETYRIVGDIAGFDGDALFFEDLFRSAPFDPATTVADASKAPAALQAVPFEILPFTEMPQIVNPPAGWFVNANNDPLGLSLDNDALNRLRPGGGIFYLNPAFDIGIRAGRITALVEEKLATGDRKISFAEMQEIQADVVLGDAQVFVPFISGAFANAGADGTSPTLAALAAEAVARLASWDYTAPTGIDQGYDASDIDGVLAPPSGAEIAASVAATIYGVWRGQFISNTIDATLKGIEEIIPFPIELPVPGNREAMKALRNLLDNFDANQGVGMSGLSFFNVPGVSEPAHRRDIMVLKSLVDALDLLAGDAFAAAFGGSTDQTDYRWGRLHRIVFAHPLGGPFNVPPAGGALPPPLEGLMGIPVDGGFETVDASRHDARAADANAFMFDRGPVHRFVAEATPPRVQARSAWPGGTSGVPGTPHYADQLLRLWLTNDAIPLLTRNNEIKERAETLTTFVPARNKKVAKRAR